MSEINLLEAKEVQIGEKTYIISKFPCIEGREIMTQYPIASILSAIPKVGGYQRSEELMYKLMAYVCVELEDGRKIKLRTRELINNHVKSWEDLLILEAKMIEYNFSFFQNGRALTFLTGFVQKLPALITEISTALSAQSSQTEKQPFTN